MKRMIPLILAICLLLCACNKPAEPVETTITTQPTETTAPPTTQPTTEPVTESSAEPVTEPPAVHRNPLNGTVLEAPYDGRVFAVTINNIKQALPHRGVGQADLFFELFVNDYATRGLAMFTDVEQVASIGSVRSTRYNFTDLCQAYEAVLGHASASDAVLRDMRDSGIDNLFVDEPIGYRDNERYKQKDYAWEHTLFVTGESLLKAAESRGFALHVADRDYGMRFAENAVPADGQPAATVDIVFTLNGCEKVSAMVYDPQKDAYIYNQFGVEMIDENTSEPMAFRNVIVICAPTHNDGNYHVADLEGSGEGWFACGGKMIPICWSRSGETAPFCFTLQDGSPLIQGVGSSYVAIVPTGSPVNAK